MDQKSQGKVMNAGFSILRKDDHPSPRIKIKSARHREWSTYGRYDTKAERDRAFDLLMKLECFIED